MLPAFPTLTTARLVLRELKPADTDAIFAIHRDTDAMRWFGADPITERAQAQRMIEMFAESRKAALPGIRWAIVRNGDGQLLGSCGLFRWNKVYRNCLLGYELGRPHWGQGLMSEALRGILRYGFDQMQLNRIQAEIHPDNTASQLLVERLGFQREGRHRQQGYWAGQFHDLDCYSLLAQDWPNLQESARPVGAGQLAP
ncbi:GNAT family N-acetyltransferase [Chitinimonas arctica]|uniref:GNAT family N-acetyltransferase n=1 Tax=Chitinimonas arctica TaxID=2594795 RepID=A0A516SLD4_9NEIS|nr:GNAT family protein [Chitinimonas arctica]QDQ28933.1 GNAT family N-acetyltransferase [Chitinimonas arctica]